jgi:hypothetical protein
VVVAGIEFREVTLKMLGGNVMVGYDQAALRYSLCIATYEVSLMVCPQTPLTAGHALPLAIELHRPPADGEVTGGFELLYEGSGA